MKKLLFVPLLIASLLAAIPAFAAEGIAVIDMRNAVLATQVAQDAFKALEEETEYAANIERATLLQTERQAIAEKPQNPKTPKPQRIGLLLLFLIINNLNK